MSSVHRHELMNAPLLPVAVRMKLVFAALTMPKGLVDVANQHEFSVTAAGATLFELRFGKRAQTNLAGAKPDFVVVDDVVDNVICLPGPAKAVN